MNMTVGGVILAIQEALGIDPLARAPRIGPKTEEAWLRLKKLNPSDDYAPSHRPPAPTLVNERTLGERGEVLIKEFEGLYLKAERDEVGIPTIGWGHTGLQHNDGTVYVGRKITKEKAEELFKYDMHQFEARVNTLVIVPLTQDQFDALVAFDFNTGGLDTSTMLRKLNAGDYEGASNEFGKWTRAGDRVLAGLVRRRKSEMNLFLGRTPFIVPG